MGVNFPTALELLQMRTRNMEVRCGTCDNRMEMSRVVASVEQPQHYGTRPYDIVEFKCRTNVCGGTVQLEIDR